jgi:hypothetical protein
MRALRMGWLVASMVVSMVVLAPGCREDRCKNPRIIYDGDKGGTFEGPAVKCNGIRTCRGRQTRPDSVETLKEEDPVIADRGSAARNLDACRNKARHLPTCTDVSYAFSPTMICLDADGGLSGAGPDFTGPTGGTLVTVGVGAGVGTGDYYLQDDGAGGMGGAGGAGGEGGFSEAPGEGGQGGN